jgi:hypothetical protein
MGIHIGKKTLSSIKNPILGSLEFFHIYLLPYHSDDFNT